MMRLVADADHGEGNRVKAAAEAVLTATSWAMRKAPIQPVSNRW